jgi:hypothetical protein
MCRRSTGDGEGVDGGWGGGGAKSYDGEKAWSSAIYKILFPIEVDSVRKQQTYGLSTET